MLSLLRGRMADCGFQLSVRHFVFIVDSVPRSVKENPTCQPPMLSSGPPDVPMPGLTSNPERILQLPFASEKVYPAESPNCMPTNT